MIDLLHAKDYLRLVEDWQDPYDEPVVENIEGIDVVRDDLLQQVVNKDL